MNAPLYEITENHRALMALLESDEDMAEAVADTLEAMEGEFDDKVISIVHVIKNIAMPIPAIDAEMDRLAKRKKRIETQQENMLKYIKVNMEALDKKKIESDLFTVTLKNGRDIVKVEDADKIPSDYMNYKTSSSPMKKEILAALKAGEEIEGVSMVKSEKSLGIK